MKIVHLIGYFQPEFGYKEYYIARNQAKAGHEVHVITSNKVMPLHEYGGLAKRLGLPASRDRGKEQLGETVLEGIIVHRLPGIFEIKDFILIKGVKKLLEVIKPDIVHAYAPNQGSTIFGPLYKGHFKYFLIGDDQILPETLKPYKSFLGMFRYQLFQRFFNWFYYKKCDVIFCPNQATKDYLDKHYHCKEKTKLVPLGYESDFFYFDKKGREDVRKKFQFTDKDFLIVLIGRITKDKGFDFVIEACADLMREGTLKILLVGEGDFKKDLKNLVNSLGLTGKVFFEEFISEKSLYKYFSAGDLGVWAKRPSVAISNAIACELPVLVPDNQFVDHLIAFGNGITFEKGSKKDFQEKLKTIVKRKDIYSKLKYNTERAQKYFDYNNLALADLESYKENLKS